MKHTPHSYPSLLVALGLWMLAPLGAQAATNAFLQLTGVVGESSDAAHPRWIDVGTLDWDLQGPTPTHETRLSALQFSKAVDAASPLLHAACASGNHFPKATLDLVRTTGRRARYYRIQLENVTVSSCQVSLDETASGPVEQLRLGFTGMTWTYTEFTTDGSPVQESTYYWNLVDGTGGLSSRKAMRVSAGPGGTSDAMNLAFPTVSGVTYRILGSGDPSGPYTEISRFTAQTDGATETTLPTTGTRQFLLIEEVP